MACILNCPHSSCFNNNLLYILHVPNQYQQYISNHTCYNIKGTLLKLGFHLCLGHKVPVTHVYTCVLNRKYVSQAPHQTCHRHVPGTHVCNRKLPLQNTMCTHLLQVKFVPNCQFPCKDYSCIGVLTVLLSDAKTMIDVLYHTD